MAQVQNIRVRFIPQVPPIDGRQVGLRNDGTYIQWRYEAALGQDATDWANIVALTTLVGPAGPSVELRNDGAAVQWRVVGASTWIDLVLLTELQGPPGPVGPVGLVWMGAYSGATAYVMNDGVSNQGGSWIALQATTGNAPPTLPTMSNAYWQLFAAPGTNGSMTGPGSSTDNALTRFDGTSGATVQNSTAILSDAGDLSLISTDADATVGPILGLYRNSASPAAADLLGKLLFQGKDSAANVEDYAEIYATLDDPTSTSEDASILIRTKIAGTMTTMATITATGWGGMTLVSPVLNTGISGSAVADQTAMETGTSTSLIVTPGRQQHHPAHPKAWALVNQTGTQAIRASYGISSIVDPGVGGTTFNFSTAFSGASTFAALFGVNSAEAFFVPEIASARSTTVARCIAYALSAGSPVATDTTYLSAAFLGDQ